MSNHRIDFDERIHDLIERERDTESHDVDNPYTFHPSQMVVCPRQMFVRHLGIDHVDQKLKGIFHTGTMLHEWLEDGVDYDALFGDEGRVKTEHPIEYEPINVKPTLQQGLRVTGTADVVDTMGRTVYDFKTQASIYPKDYHADQIQLYLHGLAEEEFSGDLTGEVVYIKKSDLTVEQAPNGPVEYDPDRVDELLDRAIKVRDAIIDLMERYERSYNELIFAIDEDDIPFEKCGCFFCENEEVNV
jgi:hypothetical protein